MDFILNSSLLCRVARTVIPIFYWSVSLPTLAESYTIDQAIHAAQQSDLWLQASQSTQDSLQAQGLSHSQLPDPKLSLSLLNAPLDSFDLHQEPMTQFKIGVSQTLPRGDTRSLLQQHSQRLSDAELYQRQHRLAQVKLWVSLLWIEVYRYSKTIEFIEQNQHLFIHLVDVAESSYASTSGSTRQDNLIRAQLELTRLEDRVLQMKQALDTQKAKLAQWLPNQPLDHQSLDTLSLPPPQLQFTPSDFNRHPSIRILDAELDASTAKIDLAKESKQPQWTVKADVGFRGDTPAGEDRSDFISLGASVDLPFFTEKRQDQQVLSAQFAHSSVQQHRQLALQQLYSQYQATQQTYTYSLQRQALYANQLLLQIDNKTETSLNAYTNDEGSFSEVVRTRITKLDAKIEALNIHIELQKSIATLQYLTTGASYE